MLLAARGTRSTNHEEECISDDGDREKLRRQVRRIYTESTLISVVLTIVCRALG